MDDDVHNLLTVIIKRAIIFFGCRVRSLICSAHSPHSLALKILRAPPLHSGDGDDDNNNNCIIIII